MKDKEILNLGKCVFGCSFLLGNICLFGYMITKEEVFAATGFTLLFFGSVLNLLVILGLLIYGFIHQSQLNVCLKSIGILLINIPAAILYAIIGIHLIQN
ncbi:hypothetical protein IQ37_19490 [Chryseobacterium piperi]|uniref:Branched-chain amino acid:cation transporter, LIVCS family n=1 Tax=Chryseobacterium piperi TaxID=558152 RepID=A0A086A472_9FLAO|nr:hypothetical protein [Chryseobacterium piperi]ASW74818.1 hypothetical protein CJF12_11375 [Chryseobacterium piperi]KFF11486.1 hypothetical protein IQ37_19490 [Chryseobacterium piperi]